MPKRTPETVGKVENAEGGLLFTCLYGAAAAMYLSPLADLLYTLVPFEAGAVQWRFGAVGFAAQTLWSQLLALAIVAILAWVKGHRWVLRAISLYGVLLIVVIVAVGGLTVLDFLQLRRAIVQPMKPKLDMAATRLFVQLGMSALVALPIAVSAWRAARAPVVSRSTGDELGLLYGVRAKQSSRGAT